MLGETVAVIVGQVATWITVFLVLLTLREMQNQRKASYRAELVVPTAFVHGFGDVQVEREYIS